MTQQTGPWSTIMSSSSLSKHGHLPAQKPNYGLVSTSFYRNLLFSDLFPLLRCGPSLQSQLVAQWLKQLHLMWLTAVWVSDMPVCMHTCPKSQNGGEGIIVWAFPLRAAFLLSVSVSLWWAHMPYSKSKRTKIKSFHQQLHIGNKKSSLTL